MTGIVVNKKIQVPKYERDDIRKNIYYLKRFGLPEHLKKIGNEKSNYLKHLLGRINYVIFINPEDSVAKGNRDWMIQFIKENKEN